MDPKKELAQIKSRMAHVVANAKTARRDINEQELTDLEAMAKKAATLQGIIARATKGDAILDQFKRGEDGAAARRRRSSTSRPPPARSRRRRSALPRTS